MHELKFTWLILLNSGSTLSSFFSLFFLKILALCYRSYNLGIGAFDFAMVEGTIPQEIRKEFIQIVHEVKNH